MSNYSKADRSAQWFQGRYPGTPIRPNVVVLHTTEGTGWPSYGGGASAPNYTARPDVVGKRLIWRAHFDDERSARALRNEAGGVQTNTLNAIQVELVGTCDLTTHRRWRGQGMFWPEAPAWALREVAAFLADMHKRHGIRLLAPEFHAYPGSYGERNPNRFTFEEWRNFYGVCGHQHVPENSHGDPGAFPIMRVLNMARDLTRTRPKVIDLWHRRGDPNFGKYQGDPVERAKAVLAEEREAAQRAGDRSRVETVKRALRALRNSVPWRKQRKSARRGKP